MPDDQKSKKLKRLVAVQRHIEKMAENELAASTRERAEVADAMSRTAGVMTSLDPVHRSLSHHYLDRYARLTTRDRQLSHLQKVQETRVARERTKADKLEEKMKEAVEGESRRADDNAVYDLLEMAVALQHASLQQA